MKHHPTESVEARSRMPVFYLPHGAGPCFFMDWSPADTWSRMAGFLKGIAASLPARPRAIVLVSGHWLAPRFTLTGHPQPALIYDYYGFPAHTYELSYPAPGQPELAQAAVQLLAQAGVDAGMDPHRGFDHGVFIPLKLVFPEADIPVVQFSLHQSMDPAVHLKAGEALAGLREQGVLIIGSGMSFHNMRGYGDPRFTPISAEFDDWLTQVVEGPSDARHLALQQWEQAPQARLCHPPGAEEHLLPLLVAAGAAQGSVGKKVYSERVMETMISAYRFD